MFRIRIVMYLKGMCFSHVCNGAFLMVRKSQKEILMFHISQNMNENILRFLPYLAPKMVRIKKKMRIIILIRSYLYLL
jgi:hypothetical protein